MKIVIIGELIVDKYYYVTTNRKAPEKNIPIYLVNNIKNNLGGAANVAKNLNNICNIEFISVLGNDRLG